jgi:hypothetical protein
VLRRVLDALPEPSRLADIDGVGRLRDDVEDQEQNDDRRQKDSPSERPDVRGSSTEGIPYIIGGADRENTPGRAIDG